MVSSPSQRRQLIGEILDIFAANLAGLSDEDLTALFDAASTGSAMTLSVKAIQTPDQSAMVQLNPRANKETAIAALRDLAGWLDENWDDYHTMALADMLRTASRAGPRLMN